MRIPPPPPWRRAAATAALAWLPLAPLHAQDAPPPAFAPAPSAASIAAPLGLPGTVDAGASVGVAHTSRWYHAGGEPGTVRDGSAFSAEVRYWPIPVVGLRLQAGTFNGALRTADPGRAPFRALTYDASVVVRPLAAVRAPGLLSTAYAFAGGGGATLDLSGTPDELWMCETVPDPDPEPDPDPGEYPDPDCLVQPASRGTVRQVTVGAGADLLRVAGFTVFAEAALHRYRPVFRDGNGIEVDLAVMSTPGAPTPRPALIVSPNDPPTAGSVVTRRVAAGVRRTFGGTRDIPMTPPPPPPAPSGAPPPSPTTGGVVTVATVEPGAEVYLVPRTALEDDPGLRCRLRPVLGAGSFFKGRTTGAQPLRVPAGPRAWVLVVRQQVGVGARRTWHVHEQRIQMGGGGTLPVQLNMQRDGRPPPPCRR